MISLPDKKTIFFGVDETLVFWSFGKYRPEELVEFPIHGYSVFLKPHKRHIEEIKLRKSLGNNIIVWSHGGAEWAKIVVETLGLQEYVDYTMSKPNAFYDDLPASSFMTEGNRIYFEDK